MSCNSDPEDGLKKFAFIAPQAWVYLNMILDDTSSPGGKRNFPANTFLLSSFFEGLHQACQLTSCI